MPAKEDRTDPAGISNKEEDPSSIRVAFQGESGAYSELAARRALGSCAVTVPCVAFRDVFATVRSGEVDVGILPIENSTAGSITETYDLLLESDLAVIGEVYLPIDHCLIVRPDASLDAIRRVSSHPQALSQCRSLLEKRGWHPCPVEDTAGAARWLANAGTAEDAVLASSLASELYGLSIAIRSVQNEATNTTRFVLISCDVLHSSALLDSVSGKKAVKTSLALELSHVPGALFDCLRAFGEARVNLTKIESRPIPERPWEYRFYIDFDGDRADPEIVAILESLRNSVAMLRVFGTYPMGSGRNTDG